MLRRVALSLLCVGWLAGCANSGLKPIVGTEPPGETNPNDCYEHFVAPDQTALLRDLGAAETHWRAAGIHSYQYDARLFAFLPPGEGGPVRYVVQNDQTVSLTALNGGGTSFFPVDGTVEALFTSIRSKLNSTFDDHNCEYFKAQYDPADGHPLEIDRGYATSHFADGDSVQTYTSFTTP